MSIILVNEETEMYIFINKNKLSYKKQMFWLQILPSGA